MLPSFFGRFAQDLGIDLGTANTLVWVEKRGVVLSEPSVVAIDKVRNVVVAVGEDARAMIGRTPPHIVTVRPLKDGVIADFEVAREMLKQFIARVHRGRSFTSPRVMIGVPSGITEVEKRAVMGAASRTGARAARLIEEPMVAALGAELPVDEPTGSMIVDIGGGTTEVAIVSLGGIVVGASSRTAGDEITDAIDVLSAPPAQFVGRRNHRRAPQNAIGIGAQPDSRCAGHGARTQFSQRLADRRCKSRRANCARRLANRCAKSSNWCAAPWKTRRPN